VVRVILPGAEVGSRDAHVDSGALRYPGGRVGVSSGVLVESDGVLEVCRGPTFSKTKDN
jgi:hypothetical protein